MVRERDVHSVLSSSAECRTVQLKGVQFRSVQFRFMESRGSFAKQSNSIAAERNQFESVSLEMCLDQNSLVELASQSLERARKGELLQQ